MPRKNTSIVIPKPQSKGHLTLPFDHANFADFVKSLLGRPQSINKTIAGIFDIDIADIMDLHHLLDQRINQQNKATLIQFTARLIYSDESSILLNSIEELETYNEVRKVVSTSIHMQWDYLVKFEDKQLPEKQSIQVSVVTSHSHKHLFSTNGARESVGFFDLGGFIDITIHHTARTWGADIESLISNFSESLMKNEHWLKKYIRKYEGWISLISAFIFFLFSVTGTFWAIINFSNSKISATTELLKTNMSGNVNSKIDFLIQDYAMGDWPKFYFKIFIFLVFSLIFAIIFGIWTSSAVSRKGPSFLNLTRESKNYKKVIINKSRRQWLNFALSILTNIICGITSSYIFILIS
jgi:hypothetical protein